MLPKLMVRDALLHGRMLLISYGLFAAFQAYFVTRIDDARPWFVFAGIYAAMLSITMFAREDKFESTAWTCALPVTRRDVVRARFVAAWLLVAAALVVGTILAAVMPGSQVGLARLLELDTLLVGATAVTVVLALMLPFLIRFGLMGMMIFLVLGQVVGAGVLLLAIVLRNNGGGELRLGIRAIAGGVSALREAMPVALFQLLVVVLLVGVNWAGYRLALFLFRRRDL
jgi:ABC-type transport system involved in multi-copper enzyme maturation permease subunit